MLSKRLPHDPHGLQWLAQWCNRCWPASLFGRMVRVGLRFVLLAGLYLLLAGRISVDELVAAALASVAASAASWVVSRISERDMRFGGSRWLPRLFAAVIALPGDSWRVGARLVRRASPPSVVCRRAGLATGDTPSARALRAVTTLCLSLTPNSFVVAELPARREWLIHVLVVDPPGQQPS